MASRAVSVGGAGRVLSRYLNPHTSLVATRLGTPGDLSNVLEALRGSGAAVVEARPLKPRFGTFVSGVIVFENEAKRDEALARYGPDYTVAGTTVHLAVPRARTWLFGVVVVWMANDGGIVDLAGTDVDVDSVPRFVKIAADASAASNSAATDRRSG